jgi:hypothetical protein
MKKVKSENYKRSRNTRVFLVAASGDESGMQALEWAVESLVQCGDELVVVRGFDADDLRPFLSLTSSMNGRSLIVEY